MANLKTAVEAAGGALDDVLLLHIYIVQRAMEELSAIREMLKSYFPAARAANAKDSVNVGCG